MNEKVSTHYDADYFAWQSSIGEFGGWAEKSKFARFIKSDDDVLDFGCGGGYLLKALKCRRRVGIEINAAAINIAKQNGVEVYTRAEDVPDDYVDVIISNNALEHVLQPLDTLKALYNKLRKNGKIIFIVPCESINLVYRPNDINHHLYTWNPMCLGNLFTEAGYSVLESKPYLHRWPPRLYKTIARMGGRAIFEIACRIYGYIDRRRSQVIIVAKNPDL